MSKQYLCSMKGLQSDKSTVITSQDCVLDNQNLPKVANMSSYSKEGSL